MWKYKHFNSIQLKRESNNEQEGKKRHLERRGKRLTFKHYEEKRSNSSKLYDSKKNKTQKRSRHF